MIVQPGSSTFHIKELAELGVDAAILGKSLYARAFTLEEALEVAR